MKAEDAVGQKFGRRRVLAVAEPGAASQQRVRVKCDCGRIDTVYLHPILQGRSQTCRSCSRRLPTEERRKVVIGERHGERVIQGIGTRDNSGRARVCVICDCGRQDDVYLHLLRVGKGRRCKACAGKFRANLHATMMQCPEYKQKLISRRIATTRQLRELSVEQRKAYKVFRNNSYTVEESMNMAKLAECAR